MIAGPRVLDLTGGTKRVPLDIVASTPVDFLISLQTYQSPEGAHTYDVGQEWFDQVRTRLSPGLAGAIERIGVVGWGTFIGLALAEPPIPDIPSLLHRLNEMPATELWALMAGSHVPMVGDLVAAGTFARAATGEGAARRELADALQRVFAEDHDGVGMHILEITADAAKDLVLAILRGWHDEVYTAVEARTAEILRLDAQAKRLLRKGLSDEALIMAATNGLEFEPDAWMRRVVIAPQLAMRPWNVMCAHDDTLIVCYPVGDESLGVDRNAPPARLLRLHKALSDDKRLRILKLLTTASLTLQEIADAVGLAKSSTHHHMVILRSAGLVRTTLADDSRYTLRLETIPQASGLLDAYLEEDTR